MAELLLEILSEEIPARMQRRAAADLKRLVLDGLKAADLGHGPVRCLVTPRRLVLTVDDLPAAQPDRREERRGPRADAPEKALAGFLGSVGLTREALEARETPKGTFLFAVIEKKGRPTAEVLIEVLETAFAKLPWPKSMRWATHATRWVRPVSSLLCLFDGAVVPVRLGPVRAGASTLGHRFLAPDPIEVENGRDYLAKLESAYVMLDPAARKAAILDGAQALAAEAGYRLSADEALLDEVTGLVEWPVPVMGRIDTAFMEVPEEVLVTSMKEHQKYFTLTDEAGRLAPCFITVANMVTDDRQAQIVAGNERVLRARLHDAKFFWDQDRKTSLESRLGALDKIIFHAKLGTLAARVTRLRGLARELSADIPDCNAALADRAARLCKADLVTDMVFEFTELQGVMGGYYARHDGEDPAVAEAIAAHYSPAGPSDDCPTAPVAVAVALAEKLDTLTGFFAIDAKPTGSKDPFALRRAALGVIRLVLENRLRLPLRRVFDFALSQFPAEQRRPDVTETLLAFFADRLKVHLKEAGTRHDLIAAIFALGDEDDLVRLLARVAALGDFLAGEDGANLMAGYKRAANILRIEEKKDGVAYDGAVDPDLLVQDEEKALYESLATVHHEAQPLLRLERFGDAMRAFARLRAPVDAFFDAVTVNCDDPQRRANRLKLLSQIRTAMDVMADFSRIEG